MSTTIKASKNGILPTPKSAGARQAARAIDRAGKTTPGAAVAPARPFQGVDISASARRRVEVAIDIFRLAFENFRLVRRKNDLLNQITRNSACHCPLTMSKCPCPPGLKRLRYSIVQGDEEFAVEKEYEAEAGLVEAIRATHPEAAGWDFVLFLDGRDGCIWVALPDPVSLNIDRCTFDLRSGPEDWRGVTDRLIMFGPGQPVVIRGEWLKFEDSRLTIARDEDGNAKLIEVDNTRLTVTFHEDGNAKLS